jgi:hypothetical protein
MTALAILRQRGTYRLWPLLVAGVAVVCATLTGSAGGAPGSSRALALSFKLDHFLCYTVKPAQTFTSRGVVVFDPQFKQRRKTAVLQPESLCNWASKNRSPVLDKRRHLLCYTTRSSQPFPARRAVVTNQFKAVTLAVARPNALCLPSGKSLLPLPPVAPPKTLDHFQCYPVKPLSRVPQRTVVVRDEFGTDKYLVGIPIRLCDPASKNNSRILNRRDHLLCYVAKPAKQHPSRAVYVTNQFDRAFPYRTIAPTRLCLPSLKRLVPLRPDLTVKIDQASLTVNCSAGTGCITKFQFTVTNIGAAASIGFDIAAAADPSQKPNPPIPPQSGLAAGASRTLTVSFGPAGNCFDPDCTVSVTVDPGNVVAESNEANNTDTFTKPG